MFVTPPLKINNTDNSFIFTSQKSKRDPLVDLMKGVGITFVVALHAGFVFLPGCMMPLFFLVSGFFTSIETSPKEGIKRKTIQLLIPLFKFSFFYAIFFYIMGKMGLHPKTSFYDVVSFNNLFVNSFISPTVPYAEPLWFLSCLWFGYLFFYLTKPVLLWVNKSKINLFVGALVLIFLYFSVVAGPDIRSLCMIITRGIYACIFIYLGHFVYKYKGTIFKSWILYCFGFFAIIIKFQWFNDPVPWSNPMIPWFDVRTMGISHKSFLLPSFIVSIFEISFVISVAIILSKIKLLSSFFEFLGKNSLNIFCLHLFLMWFVFDKLIINEMGFGEIILGCAPIFIKMTYFLFGIIVSSILVLLLKKMKQVHSLKISGQKS